MNATNTAHQHEQVDGGQLLTVKFGVLAGCPVVWRLVTHKNARPPAAHRRSMPLCNTVLACLRPQTSTACAVVCKKEVFSHNVPYLNECLVLHFVHASGNIHWRARHKTSKLCGLAVYGPYLVHATFEKIVPCVCITLHPQMCAIEHAVEKWRSMCGHSCLARYSAHVALWSRRRRRTMVLEMMCNCGAKST